MKQVFIITVLILLTTNVFSQSLEERAATRACNCLQKLKSIPDEKYTRCISTALTETIGDDHNTNDLKTIGTVTGIKGVIRKIDSIVLDRRCVVYTKEKLDNLKKEYYANSPNAEVNNSFIIGNDFLRKEKYDMAIKSYLKAFKADTMCVPVIDNLALCYRKKGDNDNAIKYYTKSLSIYAEGDYALQNIGVAYTEISEYSKSNQYYKKLTLLYPSNAEGYFGLGKNYLLLSDYENALENIFTAHKIYLNEKSDYSKDTEKLMSIIYQSMKKINKLEEFNKVANRIGLKIK